LTDADVNDSCSVSEEPQISSGTTNLVNLFDSCNISKYFIKTDGLDNGDCNNCEKACKSFRLVFIAEGGLKKYLTILILGTTFSDNCFVIPEEYIVDIGTGVCELETNGKVKLSYSAEGDDSPYITMSNGVLNIKNISIIFDDTNKGVFILLTGILIYVLILF
jgi:hypothetical protein